MAMIRRRSMVVVLVVVLLASGCPTAQQWFQIIGSLLPIVTQTYLGFAAFAQKGGVPPAELAAVTQLTTNGQDIMNKLGGLVATVQSTAGAPAQMAALVAQMKSDCNGFLADVNIKNSSHLAQYEQFATVLLADAGDIASLIPVFTQPAGATVSPHTVSVPSVSYRKATALVGVFQERLASLPH
jgi:hypothetical protein